jgi:nitrate reductase gamma subunit
LTLPTLMATGASSLPPQSFATGSAVVNMLRQIGLAIGVAVLIAILGSPHSACDTLHVYQRASVVIAAIAAVGGVIGWMMLTVRRGTIPASASASTAAAVASENA